MKADEFIREVDEELRQERLWKLWQRFGPYVIGVAVAVVLATAAKVGLETWRDKRLQEQANAFARAQAFYATDPARAAAAFRELAGSADAGFASLARLMAAAALVEAGEREEAVAVLEENAAAGTDPALDQLSALFAAAYRLDDGDPDALRARLAPLEKPDAVFRHSAREHEAVLAIRTGDRARARALVREILDDATAPAGQKQRLRELLELLGPEAPSS